MIRSQLHKRGWTQSDLAKIIARPLPSINEIIVGKRGIMPEMAMALGTAFGNGAQFWMRLEADYRLALVPHDTSDIERRLRLHDLVPIREIQKRGWIKESQAPEIIESEVCRFLGIADITQEPSLHVDTRKSSGTTSLTSSQRAWCFRAAHLARAVRVSEYSDQKLTECARRLRQLAAFPEEGRNVTKILAAHGIRFVIVEPLAGTRIDGAAFWLDDASPVIAISLRFDRIDSFWFTLGHELAHIRNHDAALLIDVDLVGEHQSVPLTKEDIERRADQESAEMLIPPEQLDSFILRIRPMYSKTKIIQFANRIKMHPGIIVGQLQHRGEIGFSANREMLIKIREQVTSAAITDGWGRTLSV